MVDNQTTIFEMIYPTYKITTPIRLISLFSGYDSQALALKYLGVDYEHYKTCEWAVKSIQALKDIHFENDNTDYSQQQYANDLDLLKNTLYQLGISSNYNEPMTKEQVNRLNEKQLRTIYNNIVATNNLVNIQQVKGQDLDIQDTENYTYLLTYSFPCQDLSLAGKGKGMSDTSTRSGMLWEVERILTECKELGSLPQILLMENVPQVHGTDNIADFNKWQFRLEELGYKNYCQDLIATDYGIPQTRNRTFMVSILGDYNYTFPKPIPLKLKLKDMLEGNVAEKYFLSDKMIDYCLSTSSGGFDRSVNFLNNLSNPDIAMTITTKAGNRATDNFIKVKKDTENYIEWEEKGKIDMNCRAWKDKIGTLNTGGETKILIKNNTKKGYLEATEGDGIDLTQPNSETRRGRVQKETIQTLTTQNNLGVCVYDFDSSEKFLKNGNRDLGEQENFPTLLAKGQKYGIYIKNKKEEINCVKGIATNESEEWQKRPLEEKSRTLLANKSNASVGCIDTNLRIRKLTPRECFRLMGVKDEDFDKVKKNQSDSSLYHLAGDSIVVNVLMSIFKELL